MAVLLVLDIRRAFEVAADKSETISYVDVSKDTPLPPTARGEGISGGLSGGGGNAETQASQGQTPRTSPTPPIVTMNPAAPTIDKPSMPVAPTLQDPTNSNPTVLPNVPIGVTTAPPGLPPSPGTGKGGGLGDGSGQGIGDKTGPGSGNNGRPGGIGPGPGKTGPNGSIGDRANGMKFGPNGANSRVHVTFKPEAPYTAEALQARVSGVVEVFVTCHADGTVSDPRVLNPLGYGLDEEAIKAAMRIKFIPKIQNGHPVDDTEKLIYTFRLNGR
jgi:protein TonB